MVKVFISYSHQDGDFVDKLEKDLKQSGFESVWRDTSNLFGSQNWRSDLQTALVNSDVMVLVVSPQSLESKEVQAEWHQFLKHDKPIVPVMLEHTELTGPLDLIQRVPFKNRPYSDAFNELVLSIQKATTKKSTAPVPNTKLPSPSEDVIVRRQLTFTKRMMFLVFIVLIPPFILSILVWGAPSTELFQPTPTITFPPEPTLVSEIQASPSLAPISIIGEFVFTSQGRIYYQERSSENRSWILSGDVPNARQPRFSPDGTRVAFIGSDFNGVDQIFVTTADENARPEQVTGTDYSKNCLSWIDDNSFAVTTPTASNIGFAIRLINLGNVPDQTSERFDYGIYESCYTYLFGEIQYVAYSRRDEEDSEIYIRNLESGTEYAVTDNGVDDLMPNYGGRDMLLYYRQIPDTSPAAYDLIWLVGSEILSATPDKLPISEIAEPNLFQTRRLSRVAWGPTGREFAAGFEEVGDSRFGIEAGIGIFSTLALDSAGIENVSFYPDATDPDWRWNRE